VKSPIALMATALMLTLARPAVADEPLQPLEITVSFPRNLSCDATALQTADRTFSFGGRLYLGSTHPGLADERDSSDGSVTCGLSALGEGRGDYLAAIGGDFDRSTGIGLLGPSGVLRVETTFTGSASAVGAGGVGSGDLGLSESGGSGLTIFNPNSVDIEIQFVRDFSGYGAVSNGTAGYQGSVGFPQLGAAFGGTPNRDATAEVRARADFGPNGCVQEVFRLNTSWPAVPGSDPLLDSPVADTPSASYSNLPPDDPFCQSIRRSFTIVPSGRSISLHGQCPKDRGNEDASALTTILSDGFGNPVYRSGYGVFTERETCFLMFAGVALPRAAATLEVTAHSPLDLLVTDGAGRRAGFDLARKQITAEIPGARYTGHATEPQTVAIPYPAGDYDAGLTGTGTGSYMVTLRTLDRDGIELDRRDVAGSITLGEHQEVAAHVNEAGRLGGTNQPPVAVAGVDQTRECASRQGTPVTLNGSASSDPDGDALTFEWRSAAGTVVGTTAMVPLTLPTGHHVFTLAVTDGKGGRASDDVAVTVQDTRAPTLAVSLTPTVLWPPNHRLVPITATITATDTCDAQPRVTLVSVTSSEPDSGLGDSDIPGDIQNAILGADDRSVALRAERSAKGPGRTYTIRYRASDAAGNATEQAVTVAVPHDQGQE